VIASSGSVTQPEISTIVATEAISGQSLKRFFPFISNFAKRIQTFADGIKKTINPIGGTFLSRHMRS
jgi:hypothetical protein